MWSSPAGRATARGLLFIYQSAIDKWINLEYIMGAERQSLQPLPYMCCAGNAPNGRYSACECTPLGSPCGGFSVFKFRATTNYVVVLLYFSLDPHPSKRVQTIYGLLENSPADGEVRGKMVGPFLSLHRCDRDPHPLPAAPPPTHLPCPYAI